MLPSEVEDGIGNVAGVRKVAQFGSAVACVATSCVYCADVSFSHLMWLSILGEAVCPVLSRLQLADSLCLSSLLAGGLLP